MIQDLKPVDFYCTLHDDRPLRKEVKENKYNEGKKELRQKVIGERVGITKIRSRKDM